MSIYKTFYIINGKHKNKNFKNIRRQIRHSYLLDFLIKIKICNGYDLISY